FIDLVRKHQIPFHEKKLGQLFCDESAQAIVDMLVKECHESKIQMTTACEVHEVSKSEEFVVRTNVGEFVTRSLVIATGGLSFSRIGATDFGYRIALQFGHKIIRTSPALDGFVFSADDRTAFETLAGVSMDATVKCAKVLFRENILFTHVGLSG